MTIARTKARIKGTRVYASDLSPAYDGASMGRTRRHWRAPEIGPNYALQGNLTTLRNRSRDLVRQNPHAARASDAFVSNLIGTGIKPLPKVDDETFNRTLRTLWSDWIQESDAAGELDFYGLQAQIMRAFFEGGECFVRRRFRRTRDGLTVPFQLQVLESEYLPIEKNEIADNPNHVIRHGIEFDPLGRRVAYHLYRTHPGDHDGFALLNQQNMVPGMTTRVPASEVLHIYLPARPGQKRGEPSLTQSLLTLRDLDEFQSAELQRQKAGRMFVGAITKTAAEDAPPVGTQDTEAHVSDPAVDVQTLEPLTMTELDEGENITWSSPPEVGDTYEAFLRSHLRAIAQSTGVMYEQLTGDYSQINDRTFRASHNEMRRQVEALQQSIVIPQLCRPVWRWFIDVGRQSGSMSLPSGVSERDARQVAWIPHAFRHIHPLQDVQAERMRVRSHFKSRHEVALENGQDVEEIDRQIARDNERMDDLGLVSDSDPRKVSQSGGAQGVETGFEDGETPTGDQNNA